MKARYTIAMASLILLLSVIMPFALGSDSHIVIAAEGDLALEPVYAEIPLTRPVGVYFPDDASNRVFTLEKPGTIKVFVNEPTVSTYDTFLDLTANVSEEGNEMGLLGMAFHPDFDENGIFFVSYTAIEPRRTVIARYSVDEGNPNQVDLDTFQVILEVAQPYVNHNGGQIVFGPDGYLYIAMGDGGGGGDPLENAQDRTNLLGAILRIDIDSPDPGLEYGIPDDNPYAGNLQGYAEEIYAYGLRNPWRISFDNETGDLWAADVGQNEIEEIDIIRSGRNYGWDIKEGTLCYEPPSGCDDFGLTDPIYNYTHAEGRSITGGFVYHGSNLPELKGKYVYGDFIYGRIWALGYDGENVTSNEEIFDTTMSIASFGQDTNGELYVIDFTGSIYRIAEESDTTTTMTDTTTSTTSTTTSTTPQGTDLFVPILALGGGLLVVVTIAFYKTRT